MGIKNRHLGKIIRSTDWVTPAALVAGMLLVLPPLQSQAWWLILPCLVCLILRWHTLTCLLLFASVSEADSWWSVGYFLVIIWLLLMRMDSRPGANNREQFRQTLRQFVLTIPVLVVMIMLIIITGSQWSDRDRSRRSATGVSESMTPGSISSLTNDSGLAMRVQFDSRNDLKPEDLYWRGLVFENFDGQTWRRSQRLDFDIDPIPGTVPAEERLRYLVTLEPDRQTWLYGLHQAYPLRAQTYRDRRGMMVTSDVIRQRVRYPVTSIPPQTDTLGEEQRLRNLTLPEAGNDAARSFARRLRETHEDDQSLINALLAHFHQQPFTYTLNPGQLNSQQSIDDFLFKTQQGFCEHYAAAMTYLLRAAGVPARVVVGYLGGQFNDVTDHWEVAQYNAHAWVEAWIPELGWQRFDPTLAVAPERVMSGFDAWLLSLSHEEQQALDRETRLRLFMKSVPGYTAVTDGLKALQYGWNLSLYDSEGDLRTEGFAAWLDRQGLGNLPVWLLILLLLFVGVRVMFSGAEKKHTLSTGMQSYLKLNRMLKKVDLERRPSETIKGHMRRVASANKSLARPCQELGDSLSAAEYGRENFDPKSFKHYFVEIRRAISSQKKQADKATSA